MDNKFRVLLSDIAIFAIGSLLVKVIQFFLLPLYTIYMTTEEYGIAELTNNFSEFLFPIFSICIYEATFRYCVDSEDKGIRVLNNSFVVMTVSSIIIIVISSFVYTIKGFDINADPVYITAWDYIGPFVWFILAAGIIVGSIFVLRYVDSKTKPEQTTESDIVESDAEKPTKNTEKSVKNEEIIEPEVSIIKEETTSKKLTIEDKWYVWGSMAFAAFLWVTNTIMQFFGI